MWTCLWFILVIGLWLVILDLGLANFGMGIAMDNHKSLEMDIIIVEVQAQKKVKDIAREE